ncbi:MAG: DNA polymerase III subunit beta [Alphaproteobacteria bacterium]|nr:DNA polymerase III subunit beta [Alphaproteobacteria bacterium]
MKLVIERAALLKSLAHVQSVVERRNTIPILSNVLIEARDGRLKLTATDMDLAIVESVAAETPQDGDTTAPAHTLYDIVRKLPDGAQVEFNADGDRSQLAIMAGRSSFSLSCLPTEDFPQTDGADFPTEFQLAAEELRGLIDRTRFAVSTEETRYYLNGIYFHCADGEGTSVLRAAATDGHRLARVEMPLPVGAENMPAVIVPRKAVGELRKLIDETSEPITVSLSETRARFAFGDAVLTTKLIDGTFPDYERVIPTENDKVLEVDRKVFAEAVDRVSTISTEKSRAVKLAVSEGSLVLSATSPENGSATETIEVSYQADGLDIGFNSRYLLDIAQQIEGDGIRFVMADASSPTLVQDLADASALFVLMPMRV